MVCEYCGNDYSKYGIKNHIEIIHKKSRIANNKGKSPWNKGLTKETDVRVYKNTESLKKYIKNFGHNWLGRHHTNKTIEKLSKARSENNKGGRSKWYEYEKKNGEKIKVQGTWELRFAGILDLIDENFYKPTKSDFYWMDKNNNKHYYLPDFYSPKLNKYFEVKGYWWGDDKLKMKLITEKYSDIKIEIVQKKELEQYEKLFGDIAQSGRAAS